VRWGEVEGLPEAEPDTLLLVSRIVADAGKAQGRTDLVVPHDIMRDDKGVIIGCKSLAY
jgi:hypothetical protein